MTSSPWSVALGDEKPGIIVNLEHIAVRGDFPFRTSGNQPFSGFNVPLNFV